MKIVLIALIFIFTCIGCAFAYPSLSGPTGGANLPDAYVLNQGQINVALDYFNQTDEGVGAVKNFRLLYGASNNLEVGLAYNMQGTDAPDSLNSFGINAKYYTYIKMADITWAVGANYQKFDDLDIKATQLYWVGSKIMRVSKANPSAVTGNIGLNWVKLDAYGTSDNLFRPFVGLKFLYKQSASLVLDYQFKNSDWDEKAMISAVLRFPLNNHLSGQFGVSNGFRGLYGVDETDLTIGINYSLQSESNYSNANDKEIVPDVFL